MHAFKTFRAMMFPCVWGAALNRTVLTRALPKTNIAATWAIRPGENMTDAGKSIERIRAEWGKRLLILGHHYQRETVVEHVDAIGDSLELARKAAAEKDAERIAFCGVHFMAESADILTGRHQSVYMPEPKAGCPMANMANLRQVQAAWEVLQKWGGGQWIPVVYVNSTAEIKAFCGANGGSTCTSSNAGKVFQWVFSLGKRVFFLPDEHLGRNTAADLAVDADQVVGFDPGKTNGGLEEADVARAHVIVWRGFCIIHTRFTIEHVRFARKNWPEARIIVHPECPREVTRIVDAHASTSGIIKYVEAAPAGSVIVVGTEVNLVERLARLHAGRVTVKALAPSVCTNMSMTSEKSLQELLEKWPEANLIRVPPRVAVDARAALDRMLAF